MKKKKIKNVDEKVYILVTNKILSQLGRQQASSQQADHGTAGRRTPGRQGRGVQGSRRMAGHRVDNRS